MKNFFNEKYVSSLYYCSCFDQVKRSYQTFEKLTYLRIELMTQNFGVASPIETSTLYPELASNPSFTLSSQIVPQLLGFCLKISCPLTGKAHSITLYFFPSFLYNTDHLALLFIGMLSLLIKYKAHKKLLVFTAICLRLIKCMAHCKFSTNVC